ncbi:MAG: PAS domain S-box protein [Bacteroidales bacterium]|nr:PAS domain S-box protein [Bacteroidales bacterium]
MRTKYTCTAFFLLASVYILCSPGILSASPKPDSLGYRKQVCQIDSLINMIVYYKDYLPDSCSYFSEEALKRSLQVHYLQGHVRALYGLGIYYMYKRNYVKALEILFQNVKLHRENNFLPGYVEAFATISTLFNMLNDTVKALEYYRQGFSMAQKTNSYNDFGLLSFSRSDFYLKKGDFSQSKRDGLLALYYFEKSKDERSMGHSYRLIGDVCQKMGDYSESLMYYNKSLDVFEKIGSATYTAILLTCIANVYENLGDFEKAHELNIQSLHIREKVGNKLMISNSLINLGVEYLKMNMRDSALYYLQKGIKMVEGGPYLYTISYGYKKLYEFYLEARAFKQAFDAYQKFEEYNQKLIKENNNIDISILNAHQLLIEKEYHNELLKHENTLKGIQIQQRVIGNIIYEGAVLILFFLSVLINHSMKGVRKRRMTLELLNEDLRAEIQEKKEIEINLRQSEERYRFLTENLADIISLLDENLNRKYVSPSCKKIFGYEPEEMVLKRPIDLVDPASRNNLSQVFSDLEQKKMPVCYVFQALRKDGTTFWAESNVNPIFNQETGELVEAITVIRDITERKKHEEVLSENEKQKELLLNEIHNRVKNNFAILISLMDMQQMIIHDPLIDRSFSDLKLRVRTMSLVHELLYMDQGINAIPFGDYLRNLSMIISSAFKNYNVSVHTDIDPCFVAIEKALPLGLIINELITNAYKYAFPDHNPGNIRVSLKQEKEDHWAVIIADDGIGLPPGFSFRNTGSTGSQIINILIQQIDAILEISNDNGSCFKIIFSVKNPKT